MQWVLVVQATLDDSQDQVPFFMETLVEFGRPEEAVMEGIESNPLDGGLDPLLALAGCASWPPIFLGL